MMHGQFDTNLFKRAADEFERRVGENAPPMHPNCRCSTAVWTDRAETMKQIKAMGQVKNKAISKSISLDDIQEANKNANSSVKEEVISKIHNTLKEKGGAYLFDSVSVEDLGEKKAFDTVFTQDGTWYNIKLSINSTVIGGRSIDEIDSLFEVAEGTVCNSLTDAVLHEMYHAKTASTWNVNVVDTLNSETGIKGISRTADKDLLETIAEVGVLKERGEYSKIPDAAKEIFEKYIEV